MIGADAAYSTTCLSQISDLRLSASDVVAQTAPQSYVISVWQFLAAHDGRGACPHLRR